MPNITIIDQNKIKKSYGASNDPVSYDVPDGTNLFDFLRSIDLAPESPCGGRGICGKCMVTIRDRLGTRRVKACMTKIWSNFDVIIDYAPQRNGIIESGINGSILYEDKPFVSSLDFSSESVTGRSSDFFSTKSFSKESGNGNDGCCKSSADVHSETSADHSRPGSDHISADSDYLPSGYNHFSPGSKASREYRSGIGAAVDLGTTTVAVSVYDLSTGRHLGYSSAWNAQASYGADVISRVNYCMDNPGGLYTLSSLIRRQIIMLIEHVITDNSALTEIVISGNTIMQHIFAGLDPSGMATAPYTPITLFDDHKTWQFPETGDCRITFCPCISSYVGGDILSGILACGVYEYDGTAMFLDIGTNGEMAIGGRDGFICCSTATGPAFEGAGIRCGMRSLPGAINHAKFNYNGRVITSKGIISSSDNESEQLHERSSSVTNNYSGGRVPVTTATADEKSSSYSSVSSGYSNNFECYTASNGSEGFDSSGSQPSDISLEISIIGGAGEKSKTGDTSRTGDTNRTGDMSRTNEISTVGDMNRTGATPGSGQKPSGVCGSGLIDILAELLRTGIIDKNGRLLPPDMVPAPYRKFLTADKNNNGVFTISDTNTDAICLYPEDVRQLQLAKAAVAAGIEILIKKAGLSSGDIDKVYIAGGFGRHLNIDNICTIGMIPAEFEDKTFSIGNSSLSGAVALLADPGLFDTMVKIKDSCSYIDLSLDPSFSDAYIGNMRFAI